MSPRKYVFIGDIHGEIDALKDIVRQLGNLTDRRLVFLGDYINKGAHSFEVIEFLMGIHAEGRSVMLMGNHEAELLSLLNGGPIAPFLKIGGASTIRSYLKRPVAPDAAHDFRTNFPARHKRFLESMPTLFSDDQVLASHAPCSAPGGSKFRISAHINVGPNPTVGSKTAHIDTGAGTDSGRLTAFFWPEKSWLSSEN